MILGLDISQTNNEFLIAFGIGSVSELPKLKEVNEIINQNPAS